MHFWIDKRSQQCGFGRSRVAASLSASSGASVGLGFGPPRRLHSSNKSSSSSSMIASNSNTLTSIHGTSTSRTQQQQQQPQQQSKTFNAPSTSTHGAVVAAASAAASSSINCYNSSCSSTSRIYHQQQLINNNNPQGYISNHNNLQQQPQHSTLVQQHNNFNNNSHHQQQQFLNPNAVPNTINNNHQSRVNGVATSASPLHQHYTPQLHVHQQQPHYQHEMRYHHPQFGNMSVRHYQPMVNAIASSSNNIFSNVDMSLNGDTAVTQQQPQPSPPPPPPPSSIAYNGVTLANDITFEQQQQQVPNVMPHTYGTIINDGATIARNNILQSQIQHQHQQQQQYPHQSGMRQSFNYQGTPHRVNYSSQCIRNNTQFNSISSSSNFVNTSSGISSNHNNSDFTYTTTADATNQHNYHNPHSHQHHHPHPHQHVHHRQLHTLIDHSENQLLPSHLKSGVCASLILASIFVAAAKFYFDHQNSGLEVLIFIAFSMTFLLAACTVSLCRIPKGMIVQRPSNIHHGEHSSRNATLCTASLNIADSGGIGIGGDGSSGTLPNNRNDVIAINSQCQQVFFARPISQEHTLAAQAGPPPYHIAILLPENACKNEEESPPPSYDKILI